MVGIFFFSFFLSTEGFFDNYGLNDCSESASLSVCKRKKEGAAKATSRPTNYPEEERKHKWADLRLRCCSANGDGDLGARETGAAATLEDPHMRACVSLQNL